jgi:hypothetical protein
MTTGDIAAAQRLSRKRKPTTPMIHIAVSQAAFDAIATTMPLGTVNYEVDRTNLGNYFIWLETHWVRKLGAMRGEREDYSDVIVPIAAEVG